MKRRHWSLQRALLALGLLSVLLSWAGGMAVMFSTARAESEKLHDRELRQVARILLELADHEIKELAEYPLATRIHNVREDTRESLGEDYRYQVWSRDGELLLGNFGPASASAMAPFGVQGYSWLEMDGARWRVYAMADADGGNEIHVAERVSLRTWRPVFEDVTFIGLMITSLLLTGGLTLWALRRLMRPMRALASELRRRDAGNLRPVDEDHLPTELMPVLQALNRLFASTENAMRREAGFIALASHELRTPLATVRALAEAARGEPDPVEREQLLADLARSADRCARLQDQLLTLSRLEALSGEGRQHEERLETTELVDEALADLMPQARARHVRVSVHTDGAAMQGHRVGMLTLLRNLLGNAMRYTPEHGRVSVDVRTTGKDVVLTVADSGPGIAPADRQRAFDRFERLNQGGSAGAGLGLSIVQHVVRMHGALITLDTAALGGLSVTVRFLERALENPDAYEDSALSAAAAAGAAP